MYNSIVYNKFPGPGNSPFPSSSRQVYVKVLSTPMITALESTDEKHRHIN